LYFDSIVDHKDCISSWGGGGAGAECELPSCTLYTEADALGGPG